MFRKKIRVLLLLISSVLLNSCSKGYNGPGHSQRKMYFSSFAEMVAFSLSEFNTKNSDKIGFINTDQIVQNENKIYWLDGLDKCSSHDDNPTNHYISPFRDGFNEKGILPFEHPGKYHLCFEALPKVAIKADNVKWNLGNYTGSNDFSDYEEKLEYGLEMGNALLLIMKIHGVPNKYSDLYNEEYVEEMMQAVSAFMDTIKEMYIRIYEAATNDPGYILPV